jgi:hypothetical protein
MACRRVVLASSAFLIVAGVMPATGDDWRLYQSHNHIAFLEAAPEIDDGYKGPIITGARAEIRSLDATLQPPRWRWAVQCCYSRKPLDWVSQKSCVRSCLRLCTLRANDAFHPYFVSPAVQFSSKNFRNLYSA